MHHTLLECPRFTELREEMWAEGNRTTDLTQLLVDIPALATRVSKFFNCYRRVVCYSSSISNEASDADNVTHRKRLMEDGW